MSIVFVVSEIAMVTGTSTLLILVSFVFISCSSISSEVNSLSSASV